MKSDMLKRSYKRMYKEDINNLKEALIVLMSSLDENNVENEDDVTPKSGDLYPSRDSHFCKNTHRFVKKF